MAAKKKNQEPTPESVEEIRKSIRSIDMQRREQSLTSEQRELLEMSAVTLRKAERTASAALQKEITGEFSDAVKELKKQSSLIRARVTRMSKVPKALDGIESVIGGIVSVMKEISRWSFGIAFAGSLLGGLASVMKEISKWAFFAVFLVLTPVSCSVLTKSQVSMAAALSSTADTVTATPVQIFENLSQVRRERGMLYSATLTSPQAHWDEVTSLSKHLMENAVQTRKAEAYIKALNSYARAMASLANTARWRRYGTELKGIGRNVDSLLNHIDDTGWVQDEITTGFARLGGRYAGILTENYMKCRQAKALKECVTDADTLVSRCVESIVTILKSDDMKLLIDNEHTALKDDYRAFLDAASLSNDMMSLSLTGDAVYVECDALLNKTSGIRTKCITALHTFARTHSKLATNFRKRSTKSSGELAEDIWDDIAELNLITVQLVKLLR